jgi:hypothetical protein
MQARTPERHTHLIIAGLVAVFYLERDTQASSVRLSDIDFLCVISRLSLYIEHQDVDLI